MLRDEITRRIEQAARAAQTAGEIPAVALPEVMLERPQRAENGDFATSLALRLKKAAGRGSDTLEMAKAIAARIERDDLVQQAAAAPPGFINVTLNDAWLRQQAQSIVAAGDNYGRLDFGAGQRVQIEFVSANPVGPLHVGNSRGAVYGSSLALLLESAGFEVQREYYVNDAGGQAETFGRTLYACYQRAAGREAALPEDGYPESYMQPLADEIYAEVADAYLMPPGEPAPAALRDEGIRRMVLLIGEDLSALGVKYDRWFSERSLFDPGADGQPSQYDRTMALLRERGYMLEKDGAVWFSAPNLDEDRENVLVRTDGRPTYFASDIAYHADKFVLRGFDRVVDIWGADHQGHVQRMKNAVEAVGVDPARLTILLYQLVTIKRGGEVVRLSKRAGNLILVRDVVDEVGADACRFFFLRNSPGSPMEFDLELAKRQSDENPVYYVQYAHARLSSVLRNAAEAGVSADNADASLLTHPSELALLRRMVQLPELLDTAARRLEPHHLPHYAQELASDVSAFYRDCRVLGGDVPPELSRARLQLVRAARSVLANVLRLMGMSAPEQMQRESVTE
jgi:arginyl-tRNA synthetase